MGWSAVNAVVGAQLINAVNNVTSLLDNVIGEVDGLLGSITQGGKTLSFVVGELTSAPLSHEADLSKIISATSSKRSTV